MYPYSMLFAIDESKPLGCKQKYVWIIFIDPPLFPLKIISKEIFNP